ncbi:MAG: hypothetical protein PHY92_10845 [Alphaproteobacteria bacterium]|nr:hypothetical protein [Alphaproteobacteria bacterium]
MRFFLIASILAPLLLAACGAPAETSTRLEPPGTPGGRMCTHQCSESRDFCRQNCDLDQRRCSNTMQAQAIQDYEAYAREQFVTHAPLELQPRDFERPESCKQKSCNQECERDYHSCYKSCGGKVVISTSCRFLCF